VKVVVTHFRNGILLVPITARLMGEWITTGRPGLDVAACLPERFLRRACSTS
jgi:glycine/D-amino acid oxidase-like deaminating enzyme